MSDSNLGQFLSKRLIPDLNASVSTVIQFFFFGVTTRLEEEKCVSIETYEA